MLRVRDMLTDCLRRFICVFRPMSATRVVIVMSNFSSSRFATPAATALLIISTILCLSTTVTSAPVTATSARWLAPCNGAHDVLGDVAAASSATNAAASSDVLAATFHKISNKMKYLKRKVRKLKNIYIRHRFRDESMDDDLSGLRLVGMPDAHAPTMNSIENTNVSSIAHSAFENLARAAVFVSQARIGETLAAHDEPVSLERDWQTIEDHPEFGIYWLLCALHRLHQPLPADVVETVGQLRVGEVDRNALRHTRDYLVLRDLEHVLERLRIQFADIGQRLGSVGLVKSQRDLRRRVS